jgi:hypothetical protein
MAGLTESTSRLTTAELLAAGDDPELTTRTLEYWRQEGLLPKATRTGQDGKRPEWTYPAEAADQLATLLRLRKKTKQPDTLRVALWLEGHPIDSSRVQASVASDLRRLLGVMTKEVDKCRRLADGSEVSTWAALEQIARRWARKRGPKAPPRYGRQKLADRERAMTLAFGLALGVDGAAEHVKEDARLIERMIGLDRGRNPRGGLPALLDGPAGEALTGFASLCSLPALIHAVESTASDEFAASRVLAGVFVNGLVTFARLTDALAVTENAIGLGAIETLHDDPNTAVWVIAFIVAVKPSRALNDNLQELVAVLAESVLPVERHARELAAVPAEDLDQHLPHLENLPFIKQVGIKQLIDKYRDEQPM